MKYLFYISLIFCTLSCNEAIEKPKELLSEDQMSQMIADFAINDQQYVIGTNINSENSTRYILKKYKVKGELFTKSYEYYMTKPDVIKNILDDAQKIIIVKDPKADGFIKKKLKESGSNLPAQAR